MAVRAEPAVRIDLMIAPKRADDGAERVAFDEARRLVLDAATPLPGETIALGDAFGRVIARQLHAQEDIVPFARSAMDGYAVRAADTSDAVGGPVTLRVAGVSYAGDAPAALIAGTAAAIATGAPLPAGADAVVPIEDTRQARGGVVLFDAVQRGEHVFLPGDDAKRGDVLARCGDVVTPGRAALLAAAGHTHVVVHRRPRVAVLCTGDELVDVSERPKAGQIRNSNATMIAAQLQANGARIFNVETVADRIGPLRSALENAVASCDLVITTGGASVGERDLVKSALGALGARFFFRSVAMRPAKPVAFARAGTALVAVLPGNPAAAFVGYATLVQGVVRRLSGHRVAIPAALPAALRGTIHAKAGRHFLVFGRVERHGASWSVLPLGNQCSSLVRTSADANALIIIPPESGDLEDGAMVDVEMLDANALEMGA